MTNNNSPSEAAMLNRYCASCPNHKDTVISGWLYVPIIGIILCAIFYSSIALTSIFSYSSIKYFHFLSSSFLFYYSLFFCSLSCFSLYSIIIFFKRKKYAPKIIIAYQIMNFILFAILGVIGFILPAPAGLSLIGSAFIATMSTFIWVPYFIFSKQVKKVFIH
ncbi:DUF2569 family protein [Martelella alba]|uniref:DUF2569 domain-containing protein n=1 Tax=Martelella alba TaxID=2590451 RepID=A0ABY2SIA3_9HYPH|nr:DUF2569 domain-containing protein [Martelella alba]